ncbi:MAG TPA: APC family permease [Thermoanaerobaculia bacterium]|nr:APC family permease [Thermoanaerobaculia bacterium]
MSAATAGRLLSVLGVTFGLAVTVGNTIGAGILRTPGVIASSLPTFWPFISVWLLGGAYAWLGANALSELGTRVPRSGGQYVFVREALGEYPGFVVGWSDWISTCGTTAAVSIVVGEYLHNLFPALARTGTAVALIALLTVAQWFSVRSGSAVQKVTSLAKALVLLILIAACFFLGGRDPMSGAFKPDTELSVFVAYILALQAVIYTYDGWAAVIYFSEEVKNPRRDIPRSMFGGLAAVMIIYLLINIAFLRVVPIGTIAGQDLAAATVAHFLFGSRGEVVIRSIMVVALISAVSSNVMMAPRVLYAMSADGFFWRRAAAVNRGGTPDVALLISSAIAALFIVTGTFEEVIAKLAFFFVANYALSFVSLFVLRARQPETTKIFRARGHPYTTGLALAASVAFLIGAVAGDFRNSAYAAGLLLLSLPLFLFLRGRRDAR